MSARPNDIGQCRCPLCGSTSARLSVSAKQLAYVTCNGCQAQIFGRSDRSDGLLRALHIKGDDQAPAKTAPAAKPAPETKPDPQPEPPKPEPKSAGMGWGIFQ